MFRWLVYDGAPILTDRSASSTSVFLSLGTWEVAPIIFGVLAGVAGVPARARGTSCCVSTSTSHEPLHPAMNPHSATAPAL